MIQRYIVLYIKIEGSCYEEGLASWRLHGVRLPDGHRRAWIPNRRKRTLEPVTISHGRYQLLHSIYAKTHKKSRI